MGGLVKGIFGGEKKTTSTMEPFSGVTKERFDKFYDTLIGRYSNPQQYGGQFTAPMNETQRQAMNNLAGAADNQALADFASGKYLDPATNPYVQSMAKQIRANATDQFKDAAGAIDTRFNNRGFYDSSSHASTLDRAADTANKNVADATTNLYANEYARGVGNMLNAQGARQSAANALLNAGNTAYDIADTDLRRRYQEHLAQQGFKQQDISNLLNYFNVGKNPTQTTTQSGGFGDIIGTALGIYAGKKW